MSGRFWSFTELSGQDAASPDLGICIDFHFSCTFFLFLVLGSRSRGSRECRAAGSVWGTTRGGMVTPITANGPEGRACRTSPFMPFRDLSGKPLDRQTTSSTPNPGFDERQVVLATL